MIHSTDHTPPQWWKLHEDELPHWSLAVKKGLLLQPSSAASERVFSLLNNSFNDRQHNSLEDYIETSIMLQSLKFCETLKHNERIIELF